MFDPYRGRSERGAGSMAKVFVSYRRSDTGPYADILRRDLEPPFDVFHDCDDIDVGDEFPDRIATALRDADVVLILIGKVWVTVQDDQGRRRLANPDDWVRVEVATALREKRGRIIPILFDGASAPAAAELCEELQPLCRVNAYKFSGDSVERDADWLRRTMVRKFLVEDRGRTTSLLRQMGVISAALAAATVAAALVPAWVPELPANFWTFPAAMTFAAFVWWMRLWSGESIRQGVGRMA